MRVRRALSDIDGVARVDIDFQAKTATVTMQPGRTLTRSTCDQALSGRYGVAGFAELDQTS